MHDGATDVVIKVRGREPENLVYGTTTARSDLPLEFGSHYLGICFRPGQSRHFLNATASELTDRSEPGKGLLRFELASIPEAIPSGDVFRRLNEVLERFVIRSPPIRTKIDDVIQFVEVAKGNVQIRDAADMFGKCDRQFQRVFLETVGINPKLFSMIMRFQHASTLIASSSLSLSRIATECGYADQSHMTHDFTRLASKPPTALVRNDVVFLQDLLRPTLQNELS